MRDPLILLTALAMLPFVQDQFGLHAVGGYLGLAILALSLDLLWGFGGIISLGQGAFFGLGGYAVATVLARVDGSIAVAAGIGAGILVPAVLGYCTARFLFTKRPVTPFFVVVVTLALSSILQQLVFRVPDLTGGHNGLIISDTFMPTSTVGGYYVMLSVFAATLVGLAWLVRSDFGRFVVGTRQGEERLRFLGGDTRRVRVWTFTIAGAVAGLGGAMYAPYMQLVTPDEMSFTFSAQVLIWVAVGGRGTLVGPAAAALALSFVSGELASSLVFYWQLILGVLFVLVVRLTPDGLYAVARRLMGPSRERPLELAECPRPNRVGNEAVAALRAEGVEARFGSLQVLRDTTLAVAFGEVRCLIGPNGAGKSTFINVISGRQDASAGSAWLGGVPLLGRAADEIAALGLQRTFQATALFDGLSVEENLFLAAGSDRITAGALTRRSTSVTLPSSALRLLDHGRLLQRLEDPVDELEHGSRKWLELAMVLAREPSVLLLDEPTAGLSAAERAAVGELLQAERDNGLTVVIVEHDFAFVREMADAVTVLHQGHVLADGSVEHVSGDDAVRRVYLGEVT